MTGKKRKIGFIGLALLIALSISVTAVLAFTGDEPTTTWNVTPQEKTFPADRPTACLDDGYEFFDRFQTQGETPGTYTETIVIDGVTVTVEITVNADRTIDFDITNGVATEVWFKSAQYFLYQYDPPYDPNILDPFDNPLNTGPVSYDTGLHDGVNNNGQYNALSHLDACIYPIYPLDADKTASGSYDRTITWTLDKYVNAVGTTLAEYSGEPGDQFLPDWLLYVDKTEVSDNYAVSGSITVYNDNIFDVPVTIVDELNDSTAATVTCPSDIVPAASGGVAGELTCTYTASTADASATLNTATITSTSTEFSVGGAVATAPVSFTENLIGVDSGTLTDDRFPAFSETVSGDANFTLPETFECSSEAGDYTNGTYTATYDNEGKLVVDTTLTDTASVKLTCNLDALVPSKTAAGTYDRTVTWELDKYVNAVGTELAEYSGEPGDEFTPNWLLYVDKTEVSDNYAVAGTITINNPAPIAQSFTVSDLLTDANDDPVAAPAVTCDIDTIPAGGTANCTYDQSVNDDAATLNTATISAAGNADKTATADVSFTENLKGVDEGTLTDDRFPAFSETVNGDANFTLPETFECSETPGDYTNGTYTATYDNEGKLVVDTTLTDKASVKLTCNLDALVPSKTAAGTYERTVTWELDKYVNAVGTKLAEYSGEPGDQFSPDWLLYVDKTEVSDNYAVAGTVTINNPAPIAQSFTVSDLLTDANGDPVATPAVTCDIDTIPAGGTANCTYDQSVEDDSATLNTATVTAAGNADKTATAGVSFKESLTGVDSGTLTDDRFPDFSKTVSGDANFTLPETFECSSEAGDYTNGTYTATYDNEGKLVVDTTLTDTASVKLTCNLDALVPSKTAAGTYDRTVTWSLDKSVAPASHSGYPGDTFDSTWTVVATKTEVSDNYAVAGTITINNPAPIAQSFTVSDLLTDVNGDPVASPAVSCDISTIPAGGTANCTYSQSVDDDSATLNTATVSATGNANQTATAGVSFTETLFGDDTVTVDDDRDTEGQFPASISSSTTFDYDETFACSTDWADYDVNGVDKDTYPNVATLDGPNTDLEDDASVVVTCEAGTIDVLKYTDGVVNDTYDWQFALYVGPDGFDGTQVGNTSSTLGDADGVLDFGNPIPALRPDTTYTICELGVAAGWATAWSIGGTTVIPYNPNADDDPAEDFGNRCFDVGAGTSYPVAVGQNLRITVDNTFPGGDPRTPGYWKNWSSCSTGGQYAKTTDDVDPDNEFVSLDEVLNAPGVSWGDFTIDSCELAVSILDQRDFNTGKKNASDAAYTLAMHLLAAQLNFGAGAETCTEAADAVLAAENLLVSIGFDDTGKYLRPKDSEYQTALDLAYTLDQYNNGYLCSP